MNVSYRIAGGTQLAGDVEIAGAKNAALPLLAGSLLCAHGVSTFHNVPRLRDIDTMLQILAFLGADVARDGTTVHVDASRARSKPIPHDLVSRLRGSIVLLGPLLARFGEAEMAYPGGCVLGKRPVHAHTEAFVQMGALDESTSDTLRLRGQLQAGTVVLPEFSVTATENILLAASLVPGRTTVHLAALEPHVQDVLRFLAGRGAVSVHAGAHVIAITGTTELTAGTHTVTSDYLEAGAFTLAALATRGSIRIHGAEEDHLTMFLHTLRRAGAAWRFDDEKVLHVDGGRSDFRGVRVQTNIFPGFPTDLQAPTGVLLTQAVGVSRIFEVLFEGRMAYLYELEKMGAHIEILNSHQALILGPTTLKGRTVASNDIRAGVAMVIAGLCAEGTTTITDVHYIERGYETLDQKLASLGARITRFEEEPSARDSAENVVYDPVPDDQILPAKRRGVPRGNGRRKASRVPGKAKSR